MSEGAKLPSAIVKVPLLSRFNGVPPREKKIGRGYSVGEVEAVGLTTREARLLGIYVDERRKSVNEENIKRLLEWLHSLVKGEASLGTSSLPKIIIVKRDRGRVFKGKTMSGRKARGLLSVKYRYTHNYKWGRKQKERLLHKRHEARRHTGGD
ncbi:MAG: ribosomal protein L13e [Thermofilaceae archaeon]|nr:ribosomal protein L13e [Thermofilaceae archaeon]MCX8180638.1 ribosomal protein L13e [Thermofilaceae archaeon]MDW8003741.1 ribosomal protein L13e [Thermofilaceae archaeon]